MNECGALVAVGLALGTPTPVDYTADDLVPPGTLAVEMTIGDHGVIDCRLAEEPFGHINKWTAAHDRRPVDPQRYDPLTPGLYPPAGRQPDIAAPAFCVIRRIDVDVWEVVGEGPGIKSTLRFEE